MRNLTGLTSLDVSLNNIGGMFPHSIDECISTFRLTELVDRMCTLAVFGEWMLNVNVFGIAGTLDPVRHLTGLTILIVYSNSIGGMYPHLIQKCISTIRCTELVDRLRTFTVLGEWTGFLVVLMMF